MIRSWDNLLKSSKITNQFIGKEEKILNSNKLIYSDAQCQIYTWALYLETTYLTRDFSYLNDKVNLKRTYSFVTSVVTKLCHKVPIFIYLVETEIEPTVIYFVNNHEDNTVIKINMYVSSLDNKAFDKIISYWKASFSSAVSNIHTQVYFTNEFPTEPSKGKLPKIYRLNEEVAIMIDKDYILAVCECSCMERLHLMNVMSAIQLPNFGDRMIKELKGGI